MSPRATLETDPQFTNPDAISNPWKRSKELSK